MTHLSVIYFKGKPQVVGDLDQPNTLGACGQNIV